MSCNVLLFSSSWKCQITATIDVSQQIRKDLEDYIGDYWHSPISLWTKTVACACISRWIERTLFSTWNWMAIFGHWQQWMNESTFAWFKTKSIQWKIVPGAKRQPNRFLCTVPVILDLILAIFPWTHCRHLIVENVFSNNRC